MARDAQDNAAAGLRAFSYQLIVPPDPERVALWPPQWVKGGGGVSHLREGAPKQAKVLVRGGAFTNPIRLYPQYTSPRNSAFWRFEPGSDDASELARLWLSVDQPFCVAVETGDETTETDVTAVEAAPVADEGIDVSNSERVHFIFGGSTLANIAAYEVTIWVRLGELGVIAPFNWVAIGHTVQTAVWSDYIDIDNGWSRLFMQVTDVGVAAGPTVSRKFAGQGGRAASAANAAGTLEVLCFYEDFPWVNF